MKISQREQKSNKNGVMDIAVDVPKDMPEALLRGIRQYSDKCANRTTTVKARLDAYYRIATTQGMDP